MGVWTYRKGVFGGCLFGLGVAFEGGSVFGGGLFSETGVDVARCAVGLGRGLLVVVVAWDGVGVSVHWGGGGVGVECLTSAGWGFE